MRILLPFPSERTLNSLSYTILANPASGLKKGEAKNSFPPAPAYLCMDPRSHPPPHVSVEGAALSLRGAPQPAPPTAPQGPSLPPALSPLHTSASFPLWAVTVPGCVTLKSILKVGQGTTTSPNRLILVGTEAQKGGEWLLSRWTSSVKFCGSFRKLAIQ